MEEFNGRVEIIEAKDYTATAFARWFLKVGMELGTIPSVKETEAEQAAG